MNYDCSVCKHFAPCTHTRERGYKTCERFVLNQPIKNCIKRIVDAASNYTLKFGRPPNMIVCTTVFMESLKAEASLTIAPCVKVDYVSIHPAKVFGIPIHVGGTGGYDFIIGNMFSYEEIRSLDTYKNVFPKKKGNRK